MIDDKFVKEIREGEARPHVETLLVEGREQQRLVLPPNWEEGDSSLKAPAFSPQPLILHSLQSIVDFIQGGGFADGDPSNDVDDVAYAHVEEPWRVTVVSHLEGAPFHRRHTFAIAQYDSPIGKAFEFGKMVGHERFYLGLMTAFEQTAERDALIERITGIRGEHVSITHDNGYAQRVEVMAGVTLVGNWDIKNPFTLKPLRSFPEIQQVEAPFILRLANGEPGTLPAMTLHESDGGKWKIEARKRVAEWIEEKLNDADIKVVTVLQ